MEKLQINKVIEDVSMKGRTYWTIETSNGKMSCFEEELAKKLDNMKGKIVEAEIIVSFDKKYRTIKSFIPSQDAAGSVTTLPAANPDKEKSMRAGVAYRYAIDLVIAGKADLLQVDAIAKNLFDAMNRMAKDEEGK